MTTDSPFVSAEFRETNECDGDAPELNGYATSKGFLPGYPRGAP